MKIVFEHKRTKQPLVSIVLLDWSIRESFHILEYLNHQSVPRELYEILWIEYYGRKAPQVEEWIKKYTSLGLFPPVDKWIVMNNSKDELYQKHQMYNIGILESSGHIITICDSDAIVKTTFVEAIIKAFAENPDIALHIEEVRNFNKRFYPFSYPTIIEEVTGPGCYQFWGEEDKKLIVLLMDEREDLLHTLNYGACLCALKEDLIRIGGADESEDYIGHICGPYDMTFRLVNAGKREVWHPTHWMYHVWHPGEGGDGNIMYQHDDRGMSTTAMEVKSSGRILPIVENPEVRRLRLDMKNIQKKDNEYLLASFNKSKKCIPLEAISFCIISTGENEGLLTQGIESIQKQNIPKYEILVCGISAGRHNVKLFPKPEWIQRMKLAKVRNYLCEQAKYNIIVLLDEKFLLKPDWYENIRNADNFDIAGCLMVDLNGNRRFDWAKCSRKNLKEEPSLLDYEEWHPDAFVSGDFMILRRSVWEKIKFDEELIGEQGDDIDFCHRASDAGFSLQVFPETTVIYQDVDLSCLMREKSELVNTLSNQGVNSFRENEFYDAVAFFKAAEEIKPSFVAGYHLGISYWKLGQLDKAEEKWQEVANNYEEESFNNTREVNQYAQIFFYLGRAAHLRKEYEKARGLFQKALKIIPRHRKSKVYLKIIESIKEGQSNEA